jgi:CO/xanthine dehydrogenase Mo-binding subunit
MSEKAVGAAIDRVDGRLKVTGAALYAADAPVAGVLHGVIVPSLIARGRVKAIDAAAARNAPGVVVVVTHENMPRLKQPGSDFIRGGTLNEDRLPLSDDRINYAGQYVAVIVAETPEQARPVTDNLADYVVPVHADAPRIEACFIDRPDPHINTLGCRGIGELSITGAAAASANAVHHAIGKRVRDLPITLDKLL